MDNSSALFDSNFCFWAQRFWFESYYVHLIFIFLSLWFLFIDCLFVFVDCDVIADFQVPNYSLNSPLKCADLAIWKIFWSMRPGHSVFCSKWFNCCCNAYDSPWGDSIFQPLDQRTDDISTTLWSSWWLITFKTSIRTLPGRYFEKFFKLPNRHILGGDLEGS